MNEWISGPEDKEDAPKTLSEKLLAEADAEDRLGRQYEGCSFYGEHPSSSHYRRAALLRQAAHAALMAETPKRKSQAKSA